MRIAFASTDLDGLMGVSGSPQPHSSDAGNPPETSAKPAPVYCYQYLALLCYFNLNCRRLDCIRSDCSFRSSSQNLKRAQCAFRNPKRYRYLSKTNSCTHTFNLCIKLLRNNFVLHTCINQLLTAPRACFFDRWYEVLVTHQGTPARAWTP